MHTFFGRHLKKDCMSPKKNPRRSPNRTNKYRTINYHKISVNSSQHIQEQLHLLETTFF